MAVNINCTVCLAQIKLVFDKEAQEFPQKSSFCCDCLRASTLSLARCETCVTEPWLEKPERRDRREKRKQRDMGNDAQVFLTFGRLFSESLP